MSGVIFWAAVALVAYTYAGYPLVLAAVSRLRRAPAWPEHTPALTLMIAAYNEEAVLPAKLSDTLALDYPAHLLQIIVAADGSDDATADIAASFAPRVETVHRPERAGKMAAINRAMEQARGEVVVFSDANNRYLADALREMARPFSDPAVGAVTGRKTVAAEDGLGYSEGLYWRYESKIRSWETRLGCCVGVNGEIFAIRRSLFRPAPPGVVNDDAWMAQQVINAGSNVVYNERAVSVERVSPTAADEAQRRARIVAGQYQMLGRLREWPWRRPVVLWELVSHKVLRPLVPFGMIAAAGASLAALFRPGIGSGAAGLWYLARPWNWLAAGAQAAFYALAAAGSHFGGALGKVAYVPRFLVDSNLAALRGLVRHLKDGQSANWQRIARREAAGAGE
ncbi:MAG: glycosyltransferase family 2 protein [Acidimicrobiia bacterium]|nr:glycosyltransferase family 2 protein [Acidimicrobiia bacterium]